MKAMIGVPLLGFFLLASFASAQEPLTPAFKLGLRLVEQYDNQGPAHRGRFLRLAPIDSIAQNAGKHGQWEIEIKYTRACYEKFITTVILDIPMRVPIRGPHKAVGILVEDMSRPGQIRCQAFMLESAIVPSPTGYLELYPIGR